MSSWRSTSSPTTEAAVCGNGRSWRTCGTSIPRRWAGDRSAKISFIPFFLFRGKKFFFLIRKGGFFFRFFVFDRSSRGRIVTVVISLLLLLLLLFLVNEDNGRVDLLSLIISYCSRLIG